MNKRRKFFQKAILYGMALFAIGTLAQFITIAYSFFMPAKKRQHLKTFTCFYTDVIKDSAKEIHLRGNRIVLVNSNGNIMAFSATCPHLGCGVTWDQKKRNFLCPCHMAEFDINGQVLNGPPPGPLNQYVVKREGNSLFVYVPDNSGIMET